MIILSFPVRTKDLGTGTWLITIIFYLNYNGEQIYTSTEWNNRLLTGLDDNLLSRYHSEIKTDWLWEAENCLSEQKWEKRDFLQAFVAQTKFTVDLIKVSFPKWFHQCWLSDNKTDCNNTVLSLPLSYLSHIKIQTTPNFTLSAIQNSSCELAELIRG